MMPPTAGFVVVDALALLAYLHDEPGAAVVDRMLDRSLLTSVNYSEVMQKVLASSQDPVSVSADLALAGVTVLPFTPADALEAGASLAAVPPVRALAG